MLVVFLLAPFILPSVFASGSYRSITSLDQYGSSPQINNARLASKLNAMPTIVTFAGPTLIAITLEKKKTGIIPRCKCKIIGQSDECVLATVGSGLASDATFLNKLLRRDVMHSWERYDAYPDCSRVARTASKIMLAFMGYDDEICDGSRNVLFDNNGDRLSIGRPMAVNTIVARLCKDQFVDMMLVEPSGVVTVETFGRVLGKGADKGTDLLKKIWKPEIDEKKLKEECIKIMREMALGEYLVGDHGRNDDYYIVVETLDCRNGMTVKRIPFDKNK